MSLNNPQVQLVRLHASGVTDRYFMYVTTHLDSSNYEPNGCDSISGPDSSGRLTLELQVTTSGVALRLNKPVVHQIELEDIEVSEIVETEVKIYHGTTLLGTSIVHQDESETVVKPIHSEAY